ncbi:MAG: methyl-accepting chemotaxis protein [Rhodocyclaceae bacterium]|jgi:methyl-accepting chemotaxis protein|nr:methyl-accepting chemotaxis protein [Rhodocyclaceae bacterium]
MNSIKAKIFMGGILAGLISLILAVVGLYGTKQGTEALAAVYEKQVVPAAALKDIDRHLKDMRYRMAAMLTGTLPGASSVTHVDSVKLEVPKQWAIYKENTRDSVFDADTREQISIIDQQILQLPQFIDKLAKAFPAEDKATVGAMLDNEWPVFHSKMLKPLDKLVTFSEASVKQTYEASHASGQRLIYVILGVCGVGVLVLLAGILLLAKNINCGVQGLKMTLAKVAEGDLTAAVPFRRGDEFGDMGRSLDDTTTHLKGIVEGVKGAADKAAGAARNLSQQLEQVIARSATRDGRVMQVAAAMEEISVANSEVANAAGEAGVAVERNEKFAHEGDSNMDRNRVAMAKVVATANHSVEIVSNLSNSIQKIGQITTVIREIADQTNLLALNAAIEAARAGEQGRGFAVVADEVRKLAERTSSSTSEISGVVKSIRDETEAAVESMGEVKQDLQISARLNEETDSALKQIVTAANQVTGLVGSIAASTREQTSATENVARNMEEISGLTEEDTASMRQAGQAAEDVSHIATELQQLVGKLRVS